MRRLAWSLTLTTVTLLLGSVLVPASSVAGPNCWTTGGPAGLSPVSLGNSLAIDPRTRGTLYATSYGSGGVAGGVFKTTDGGATWSPINNGLPTGLAAAIVVDPQSPSTLYVTLAPATGVV